MALIKYGPTIASASGSVGGTTYARNRAGAYMRQRSKPVIPNSTKREQINAWMDNLLSYWQVTLSTAQREVWNAAAALTSFPNKLGDSYVPTGINLFVRSNMTLLISGQAIVTVPPVQPVAPQFAPTLTHVPATGIQVTAVGNFDAALIGNIIFHKSSALRRSINYHKGPWASYSASTVAWLCAVPQTLMASGTLQSNSRYFIRFVTALTAGGVSSPSILSCDVGAVV